MKDDYETSDLDLARRLMMALHIAENGGETEAEAARDRALNHCRMLARRLGVIK